MAKSSTAKLVKKDSTKSAKSIQAKSQSTPRNTGSAQIISASSAKRGLGRGLSALMGDSYSRAAEETKSSTEISGGSVRMVKVSDLQSGKYQPRGFFDETALSDLSDSIRKNGVMQPILVRPISDNGFEIIAGERRWRAAKMAGLAEIPALVRDDINDPKALELALVENVQREGLHPLEEAAGYRRLMDEFTYTQEELSAVVHKSRSHIANLLRLLTLPKDIRLLFADDKISMGHARALMGMPEDDAVILANEIVRRELSVRQTEKFAREGLESLLAPKKPTEGEASAMGMPAPAPKAFTAPSPAAPASPPPTAFLQPQQPAPVQPTNNAPRDPDILALEETLSENLGLKVQIQDRGQSGEITILYESLEQLDEILRRLGGSI